ncbi:MAG: hypothetical protein BroJett025_04410 [Patescibacteria group bacterium]|nr:MAG: hypothetical protein BroJett025_04410 [Patescibacteria group bacterium]
MNKKLLPIIGVVLLVIVGGIFLFTKGNKTEAPQEEKTLKKRKISEPVNVIDISERPYILVKPNSDGRNLTIEVDSLKKDATEAEYELEYKSGSLQQGVFGSLSLASLPASTKQLMGSCSAGGKCSYHEDVTGGSLTTRFIGKENYALKAEWRYIENKEKATQLGSTDAKFQMSGSDLSKISIAIIGDASGLPDDVKGTVVSAPYFLSTIPAVTGTAELTMRANEEGDLKIMGWDGKAWKEFKGTVDGKSITAKVDLLQAYVVVK